ncbi:DUF1456 family protein [Roseibacillus persicicus]|uniref:DUF1456 family protein n=1 Tax=Roseibacillus persicicus TaxID=454148 RepID=UPI00280F06A0|nr:DUF1456 family protein [Roseibacillus persicicus]MDQ8191679.1 DUF1456 family protein [Roseibacillus persicicus]
MTKNDILRRLRYALQINDGQMAEIIGLTGEKVEAAQMSAWTKGEADEGHEELSDRMLCRFLDGLIIQKRGPRPDGSVAAPLEFLSNNEVLRKLRIAFEYRDEDMNKVFERVEFVVTKAELSSFFRKEGHRNYRKCPEQVLRKFLQGLSKGVGEPEE